MVTEEHLAEGRLYPPLNTIREVSFKIAVKVSKCSHMQMMMMITSRTGLISQLYIFAPITNMEWDHAKLRDLLI